MVGEFVCDSGQGRVGFALNADGDQLAVIVRDAGGEIGFARLGVRQIQIDVVALDAHRRRGDRLFARLDGRLGLPGTGQLQLVAADVYVKRR